MSFKLLSSSCARLEQRQKSQTRTLQTSGREHFSTLVPLLVSVRQGDQGEQCSEFIKVSVPVWWCRRWVGTPQTRCQVCSFLFQLVDVGGRRRRETMPVAVWAFGSFTIGRIAKAICSWRFFLMCRFFNLIFFRCHSGVKYTKSWPAWCVESKIATSKSIKMSTCLQKLKMKEKLNDKREAGNYWWLIKIISRQLSKSEK